MTTNPNVCSIYLHVVTDAANPVRCLGLQRTSRSYLRTQMLKLPPSVHTLHFCKKKKKGEKNPQCLILRNRQLNWLFDCFLCCVFFFLLFFLTDVNIWTCSLFWRHATWSACSACVRACAVVQPRLWMSYSCTARWPDWTADEWSGNY